MADLFLFFTQNFFGSGNFTFLAELLAVSYCSFVLIFGVFGIFMMLKFVFSFFRG